MAWLLISFAGETDGIKILSNFGGFPAAISKLFMITAFAKVMLFHQQLTEVD